MREEHCGSLCSFIGQYSWIQTSWKHTVWFSVPDIVEIAGDVMSKAVEVKIGTEKPVL